MNTSHKKLLVASLLFVLAAASLRAQSNVVAQTASNTITAVAAQPTVAQSFATVAQPVVFLVIACLFLYFRHRRNQMMHETIRAMVDKSVPIPPALLDPRAPSPRKDLRTGWIMLSTGAGLLFTGNQTGWIVLFIGATFVLVFLFTWLLEKNRRNSQQPGN